jgi:putative oxidoreductase
MNWPKRIEQDIVLTVIRVGLGIYFVVHGWQKLLGGTQAWFWLGQQMSNFGIYSMPTAWGFAAMCAELFGGIALTLGLYTRLASALIVCVMVVATTMHWTNGDPILIILKPFLIGLVLLQFCLITGGGTLSLDYWLRKGKGSDL